MEPEIQRLLAKHKAELQAEREKSQDSTRSEPSIIIHCCQPAYPLHKHLLHTCCLSEQAMSFYDVMGLFHLLVCGMFVQGTKGGGGRGVDGFAKR